MFSYVYHNTCQKIDTGIFYYSPKPGNNPNVCQQYKGKTKYQKKVAVCMMKFHIEL